MNTQLIQHFTLMKISAIAKSITGTKKQKCAVTIRGENNPIGTASYWDGGSRSCYVVFNLETGNRELPPAGQYPYFQASYTLQPREIMIQTGTFCGKEATPSFTVNLEDAELFSQVFDLPLTPKAEGRA